MNHYAGLDVSLEKTAICILNEDGIVIRELVLPAIQRQLRKRFIRSHRLSGAWASKPALWRPGSMQVLPILVCRRSALRFDRCARSPRHRRSRPTSGMRA